jgi:hypothetical protein
MFAHSLSGVRQYLPLERARRFPERTTGKPAYSPEVDAPFPAKISISYGEVDYSGHPPRDPSASSDRNGWPLTRTSVATAVPAKRLPWVNRALVARIA